ncbi:MAG: RnfABCDGE type electron transport complex subunit D, partial [Deltaproteobacteria bacterium]|nr:RnfABCDGE type electron transport complex subunit D [Deltaproteobacteria bacterium]
PRALWIIFLSMSSAVLTEALIQILFKAPGFRFKPFLYSFLTNDDITVLDGSALVTGLLLAFTLPPNSPFWVPVVGSFVAVAIGKQVFGGMGYNIFNPALVGRAFILAAWPGKATSFTETISWSAWVHSLGINPTSWVIDGISTATPLALLKLQSQATSPLDLIIGSVPGSLGETSAIAILFGAAYLLYKGTISWHIPVSFVGTVLLLSFVLGENPVFHIFAGGLLLGAFFMATDVVTSPVTKWGRIIFGAGAGAVTLLVRVYGAYPEGVCYSILLMNALTPLIDRYTFRTYQNPIGEVSATKGERSEN